MDFESLRSTYKGYSDEEILSAVQAKYEGYSVDELKTALNWKPVKRSAFAAVNDTVIEGANAVAGGVKAVGDFIAPGNRVSSFIDENIIKAGEASQSDEVKAEKARLAREVQNADGMLGEAGAALGYVARNPVLAAAQAAGSFVVPGAAIKGAGLVGRAAGIGAGAAGLGGGVLAGAALSGGDAAGQAYELAKRAGASEEEAVAAARQASVIPAAVGGATGAFGAERVFAGAKGYAGGAAARALKTGASEAGQEALEEGVTQYEAQRAAQPFDPSIDPMKGVASAATLGAALGGITGAGVGMLSGAVDKKRDPVPDILDAPDVDAALKAASDGVFGKDEGLPLPDTEVTPEQALMRIEAEAQRANRQNVNDWSILGGERAPAEPEADWLQEARALAQADQQQVADEQRIRAEALAPVEPVGDAALPVLPGGRTWERDLSGITLDAEAARAEAQKAADLEHMQADVAEQNVQQAAVQRAAALEGESPLAAALRRASLVDKRVDNPAPAADERPAEPRVVPRTADMRPMSKLGAEQQAAKLPGSEVVRIQNRSGKFAYTVLPPERAAIQPTDLLTQDGFPYGSRTAATLRARKEGRGFAVVEVPGGFAVRPQEIQPSGSDIARDGAAGSVDAGRGDGTALVPEQRSGDVQPGATSVAGTGVVSVRDAGVSRSDPGRPAGALTAGDTFEQNGKAYTVVEATGRMIRAQDADGNKRMIAVGSKAHSEITAAAAAPQPQPAPDGETAAATEAAAPINAAAPAQPAAGDMSESAQGDTKPPVVAAPARKEPWQMTRREWTSARERARPDVRQSNFTRASGSEAAANLREVQRLTYGVSDAASARLKAASKDGTSIPRDELDALMDRVNTPISHRDVIEKAIADGRPVSAEVLAEYPDLKKNRNSRSANAEAVNKEGGAPDRALDQGGSPADPSTRDRPERRKTDPEVIALRKRESILKSILECLG